MSHRYHTREMARLGGNLKLMPILGSILAFTAFASLGLPGLAGFWGEFMSLLGAYNPAEGLPSDIVPDRHGAGSRRHGADRRLHAVDAPEGQSRRAERRSGKGHQFHDVDRFELAAWVPLIILIVAIGVFPKIIFGATTDAVVDLVSGTFATDATAALTRVFGG